MHSWSYYVTLPKDASPEVDDNRDPQMNDDEAMDYPPQDLSEGFGWASSRPVGRIGLRITPLSRSGPQKALSRRSCVAYP